MRLTVAMVQAQWQQRKAQDPHLTQAEIARQAGLSPALFGKILKGLLQGRLGRFNNECLSTGPRRP